MQKTQTTWESLRDKYAAHGYTLPETLPPDWVFNAPPVCTAFWTNRDWVVYAAARNMPKLPKKEG
jgi:hypothetical protein